MYIIQQITSDALQQQKLILPDGTILTLQLYYRPMQLGWFIESLVYNPVTVSYGPPSNYVGPFVAKGIRITNSPNLLNQFRNQIPFGIACYTQQNREPTQAQDFASGAAALYLLDKAEVAHYAGLLTSV